MESVFLFLLILLMMIITSRNVVSQQSPCPNIFQYVNSGYERYGRIAVNTANISMNEELHLRVEYTVRGLIMDGEPEGSLVLEGSNEEVLRNIYHGNPIYYKLYFPPKDSAPIITKIKLNRNELCSGRDIYNMSVTKVISKHFLKPNIQHVPSGSRTNSADFYYLGSEPSQNWLNNRQGARQWSTSKPSTSTTTIAPPTRTTNKPTTTSTTYKAPTFKVPIIDERQLSSSSRKDKESLRSICGIVGPIFAPRIVNGNTASKGEFRWLVALFVHQGPYLNFTCGATLISSRSVLTAAHCIKLDGKQVEPTNIVVAVGRYEIEDWRNHVENTVERIEIHSDYDDELTNYDADIAVIIVQNSFVFTDLIKPVCLWMGNTDIANVVDRKGTVIGWGQDENGKPFTSKPNFIEESILSFETCRLDPTFENKISYRTFCAGGEDNRGTCSGDSGGGMVIHKDGRWLLRGIVSGGITNTFKRTCDVTRYTIYTDVAKFLGWIERVMAY